MRIPPNGSTRGWLWTLRRYVLFIMASNLAWETLHLPLYTIWTEGTPHQLVFSVVHCTGGDILIALGSLVAALVLVGSSAWPRDGFIRVLWLSVTLGLAYTAYSEWLNVEVRRSWTYSSAMPTIPPFGTGLSPLLQWLLLPTLGLVWARRGAGLETRVRHRHQ